MLDNTSSPVLQNEQGNNLALSNTAIINKLMGSVYLTEGEIKILSSRKISALGDRGLSTNEILTYIFLKLHASGGKVKLFRNSEIVEYAGISSRDVYHVLEALRKAGLIGIERKVFAHTKTIVIRHYSENGPAGRFLSLNRTFFHKGCDDYEDFKKLPAGAKSALLYLLFREKFRKNERGVTVAKSFGNSIEVTIDDIVKITKVQKETVIMYIKNINEHLHGFLSVVPALYGNANDRRLAHLQDKRVVYGGVTSNAARRNFSTIENQACGFWRMFDIWLQSHGFRENLVPVSQAERKSGDFATYERATDRERFEYVKADLFNKVICLLKEGVDWVKIYNEAYAWIKGDRGISEFMPYYLYVSLSPIYQSKNQISV